MRAETFPRSLSAVAVGGTIGVVGFVSGFELRFPGLPLDLKTIRLTGTNCGPVATFRDMVRAVAQPRIEPVLDTTVEFPDAHAAYRRLEQGGALGKVVVTVG
ncbi:zinc-binding dehydrogenase [Streptomyces canarius]